MALPPLNDSLAELSLPYFHGFLTKWEIYLLRENRENSEMSVLWLPKQNLKLKKRKYQLKNLFHRMRFYCRLVPIFGKVLFRLLRTKIQLSPLFFSSLLSRLKLVAVIGMALKQLGSVRGARKRLGG